MEIVEKIKSREAVIGIIGLGYVGLPLLREFLRAGFRVIGFDTDEKKVRLLKKGESYIKGMEVSSFAETGRFTPTADFSLMPDADCILICVPTPLGGHREPDLSYVLGTAGSIARGLRKGQLIVLESTTYPGTTEEELRAELEKSGLKAGEDFYLAYSPEREDPGSPEHSLKNVPKVVGGLTERCLLAACALYETVAVRTVPVSSTREAEASKLLENIYRAVNIALVNELKLLFDRMGIDVWEVIEAAKTKPFGFEPFYPGPGLGGHCIPIDPFYLTWKARQYDFSTRFIELAGEINTRMPYYVVEKAAEALNRTGKTLGGSKILLLGVAYKKDVDDQRESPSLKIIRLLREKGADVSYNDPHVPVCRGHRSYPDIDMKSGPLNPETLGGADMAVLVTDHSAYDYRFIERHSRLILDTRDAFRRNGIKSEKVLRA